MIVIRIETMKFLEELALNNNREWFADNREAYNKAKLNFEKFVQEVISRLSAVEKVFKGLEAGSCIFRINRDTRFLADKSPYKTNFGALIMQGGRKNIHRFAGYYIHLEPGESMIAGGAYIPPTPWLTAIREKIAEEPVRFISIIENKNFKKYFGKIENDKLKSIPRGFNSNHPHIELLKYKSFIAAKYLSNKEVLNPGFLDHVIEVAITIKPLNDFLNECAV
ncbi:MAG: DUF2461 domain-containing protein, partial [Bacteroidales bacterium]